MNTCRTSRAFPAKPAAVYAAFADPSRLATWWGPDGFTNTMDQFDFRAGGRWTFSMHSPDGQTYPNECRFMSLIENEQIVIQHASHPAFILTITLQEQGPGTLVTWEQVFADAAVAAAMRPIAEPANDQNLSRWIAAL